MGSLPMLMAYIVKMKKNVGIKDTADFPAKKFDSFLPIIFATTFEDARLNKKVHDNSVFPKKPFNFRYIHCHELAWRFLFYILFYCSVLLPVVPMGFIYRYVFLSVDHPKASSVLLHEPGNSIN